MPDISIVLEGLVVLKAKNVCNAIALLFALIYCVDLTYPKKHKYFFETIQKILMGLDDGKPLTPKVQGLKTKLQNKSQ
jgi:hypothetical protein